MLYAMQFPTFWYHLILIEIVALDKLKQMGPNDSTHRFTNEKYFCVKLKTARVISQSLSSALVVYQERQRKSTLGKITSPPFYLFL